MILAVDIGNTNTTLGLFSDSTLAYDWRTTSSTHRTSDEYGVLINQFLTNADKSIDTLTGIVISSVVPSLTDVFAHMSEKYLSKTPLIVSHELDFGVPLLIDDPQQLGADRICNAVAAVRDYDLPLIVVDFGVETSAEDLFRRAAKLPKIDFHFPEKIIGTNTVHSMQSGIMNGAIAVVDSMVTAIEDELADKVNTVATGGFAHLIIPKCATVDKINTHLTLEGLNYIWQMNNEKIGDK